MAPPTAAEALREHRQDILSVARKHGARSVRVIGSVARGTARPDRDLDLLVRLDPGRSTLDLIAIEQDLRDLLGVRVPVVSEARLKPRARDAVLAEAVAV